LLSNMKMVVILKYGLEKPLLVLVLHNNKID
jgi:hypothetical protein